MPIIHFIGRHDQMTPSGPVTRWMDDLAAPMKVMEWFEHSAHMPMQEKPGHFLLALLTHVHPIAMASTKTR